MVKSAFEGIKTGLEQAIAYAKGDTKDARTTVIEVPDIDVLAIRKARGLSQQKFADRYGLEVSALRDWEQGRRRPDRAARAYLRVIEREPEAVERALS